MGVAARSEERQRAAALSGIIAHACEHSDIAQDIAAQDTDIANILRALNAVKHSQYGRVLTYQGIKVATAFVLCAASSAAPRPTVDTTSFESINIDDHERVCFHAASSSRSAKMIGRNAEECEEAEGSHSGRRRQQSRHKDMEPTPKSVKRRREVPSRERRHNTWTESQGNQNDDSNIPPWQRRNRGVESRHGQTNATYKGWSHPTPQATCQGSKGSGKKTTTLPSAISSNGGPRHPGSVPRRRILRHDF